MELKNLKGALEAVLFAHAEPLSSTRLADIFEVEQPLVERLLVQLRDEFEETGRGVQLIRLEGAWQFATKAEHGDLVKKALDTRRNSPLTSAALEVLAIIAYNQPVSRSFIEQVRGVDSSSTVANLSEKGLIAESGRLDLPGRPIAFRTTDAFLRSFGLASLSELPPLQTDNIPEDDSALYTLPIPVEGMDEEVGDGTEPAEETRALRGGSFIEGEGGAADLIGEDE